jgi:hypothetical protein
MGKVVLFVLLVFVVAGTLRAVRIWAAGRSREKE